MKMLIYLLATASVCNASLLNLLGGKGGGIGGGSHVTYNVVAAPSHDHDHAQSFYHNHIHGHSKSHGFGNSPQVIKIILDQRHTGSHAGVNGYSYASGYNYGSSGYGHEGEAQIFKVINENSAGNIPVHVDHGHSAGASYASGYSHGGSSSYNSQFNAILPHILQLILQDDGGFTSGGFNNLNSQLIAHFGQKGKAIITRSNGKTNSYYSGGHVVQKGHLKITRVEEEPVHSIPVHRPPPQVYYSHGPSIHGPPSHNHGW